MTETDILKKIMIAASQAGAVTFRNNVGNGVLGTVADQQGARFHIVNGRRVQFGLCPGSSDLIGWRTITVTPEMIGKRVALFLAMEVKTATGKPTPEQVKFIQAVRNSGGLSGIVRSPDDAIALLNPLL